MQDDRRLQRSCLAFAVLGAMCGASAACSSSDAATDGTRDGAIAGSGGSDAFDATGGAGGAGGDLQATPDAGGAGAGGAAGAGGDGAKPDADAAAVPPNADAARDASTAIEAGPARAGVFVAVGYGGRTTRSIDDGRTWIDDASLAAKGGDDNNLLRTVLWGKAQFVALGYRVLSSSDGHVWTAQGGVLSQWIGAAVYAKGTYVAVGGYGLRGTSSDGVTWKAHAIDEVASHEHGALVYGDIQGGRFVSANDDGRRSYATDGTDWKFSTGATAAASTWLAYGQGVFVGIGDDQVVLSRDGGATWTVAAKLAARVQGLVYAEEHFTALADGHVFTSPDGAAWQDHPASGAVAGALAYGHGTYVVVRDTSFRRSSDGVTWGAPIAAGGANAYEWITFGAP